MKLTRLHRKLFVSEIPPVAGLTMPEGMHVEVRLVNSNGYEAVALDNAILPLFAMAGRFEMLANMIDAGNHSLEYITGAAQALVDELQKARQ